MSSRRSTRRHEKTGGDVKNMNLTTNYRGCRIVVNGTLAQAYEKTSGMLLRIATGKTGAEALNNVCSKVDNIVDKNYSPSLIALRLYNRFGRSK